MTRLIKRIKYYLKRRHNLNAVHAEALFIDKVWKIAKLKAINTKIDRWYVMTPANYDYFRGSFHTKYDKIAISKILRERYRVLFGMPNMRRSMFGLHVHLSLAGNLSIMEQERLISESFHWFKEVFGFYPREIVFGWWLYDRNSVYIAKKYGLRIIKPEEYNSIHDYNWQGIIEDDE